MLSDSVALLQEMGERMPNECDVSHAEDFFFGNSEYRSQLGASPSRRRSVGLHVDLTLLHYCTLSSFVTELVCALEHSSITFALSQDCHKNRVAFVMVVERG